jgi:hypothetical protein
VLSITCDNASCNDTMIQELVELLQDFGGEANHTRCFLHIINLVAKMLIKQFDVPCKKADAALDEAEQELEDELQELAEGMELEEMITIAENAAGDRDDDENDDIDDVVADLNVLMEEDGGRLGKHVQPIRLVLVKVWGK